MEEQPSRLEDIQLKRRRMPGVNIRRDGREKVEGTGMFELYFFHIDAENHLP